MNFARLLCSVALLLNAILAHAQGFKIADIRINGLQRVSAGSVFGALAAGIIVGLVEAMTSFVLPSSMKSIGIYLLYLGVVFFRPSGLFGRL